MENTMKRWIKFETGAFDGLSLQTLKAKHSTDYYRDVAIMTRLLTLAGKTDLDGALRQGDGQPMTVLQIGIMTGLPVDDLAGAITDLSDPDVGIVAMTDDGAVCFAAWSRYQDGSRAEYKRARRAAAKADAEESDRIDDLFAQWWEIYPRRVAKAEAMKAWKSLAKTGIPLEEIIAATQYLVDDPGYAPFHGEMQYIPYPATWLRGHRYEEAMGGDA